MIAHLRGEILRKSPQEVVVDVAGVGYRVLIPVSTFYKLGPEGDSVRLLVHTHVREDALSLFGFASRGEQALFERLIGVAGVGPKLAVNILSGIEAGELAEALRASDVARLTRIPGVGKKTAERICLELRDKLVIASAPTAAPAVPSRLSVDDDVQSALVNLGYRPKDAELAVEKARQELGGEAEFSAVLRRALRQLTK